MLFYDTVYPKTLQLLKEIQSAETLRDVPLAGGTALALQIGHRISIYLDFFSTSKLNFLDVIEEMKTIGKVEIANQSKAILGLFINEIKVDIVSYNYQFLEPFLIIDSLKLASIKDIAAMKLAAICGRGSKKDFFDLFYLFKFFTLSEMMDFYIKKFPDGSPFLVYRSLTYFVDADLEPNPNLLKGLDWEDVKNKIISEVKEFFP